jgi:hypothetical protein
MLDRCIGNSFILCLLLCIAGHPARAQYETVLSIVGDTPGQEIKAAIEKNGRLLLTGFNSAQAEKRSLSLEGITLEKSVLHSLQAMWEVCPFRCGELEIVERCLQTFSGNGGWQVRNLPVLMEPGAEGEMDPDNRYRELVIHFDLSGNIRRITFALESNLYGDPGDAALSVTDLRERSIILEFLEQVFTAYCVKDLVFLKDLYSESVLTVGQIPENNRNHLEILARVFRKKGPIHVRIEDVRISRHRTQRQYGANFILHCNLESYSDRGYIFMLWDFTNAAKPKILLCTWQPQETPRDKLFNIIDSTGE